MFALFLYYAYLGLLHKILIMGSNYLSAEMTLDGILPSFHLAGRI